MAQKGTLTALALVVVVVMVWDSAEAQSSCTPAITSLSSCLNFITGNSSTPAPMCCSQLNTVVQSQPQCLCSLIGNGASQLGIQINQTLALSLPGACKVQTPPLSQCNAAANGPAASAAAPNSAPAGSPVESAPSPSTTGTPETPNTPSESDTPATGGGSKNVPSTKGATSGGSTSKSPIYVAVFLVIFASCVSTGTRFRVI